MHFSHIKPTDTIYRTQGLRSFFAYRDLGVKDATDGRVVVQLVKANDVPGTGTGWHYHEADYHVVYMISGWAKFMYEEIVTLVEVGDCVHQCPGIRHYLFDYSPDMVFLEIVGPASFTTIEADVPYEVPVSLATV